MRASWLPALVAPALVLSHSSLGVAVDSGGEAACPAIGCEGEPGQARSFLRWRTSPYGRGPDEVCGGAFAAKAFKDAGFGDPVKTDDWDLLWTNFPQDNDALRAAASSRPRLGRLVNHCDQFMAAGQRCHLAGHVKNVQRATSGKTKARYLRTFNLKVLRDVEQWLAALRTDPEAHWVVKQCAGGSSKDVRLVRAGDEAAVLGAINTFAVAQEYLGRLALSKGGKFQLRTYVLVTSWSPVRAYWLGGFVWASTRQHDPARPSQWDLFCQGAPGGDSLEPRLMEDLWVEFGPNAEVAKSRVVDLLAEVFGTAVELSFGSPAHLSGTGYDCFDLFGAEVIFDADLWPYVMEVDQGPNIWVSESADRHPEWAEITLQANGPSVRQVAAWAAHRAGHPSPLTTEDLERIENRTLPSAIRLL